MGYINKSLSTTTTPTLYSLKMPIVIPVAKHRVPYAIRSIPRKAHVAAGLQSKLILSI